jgi:outer membrane protein OmpA-like peptidoglycan-associated protein
VIATVDDGRDGGMVSCTVPLTLGAAPGGGAGAAAGGGAMAGASEVLDFVCPEYPAGVTDADNRCKAVLDDVALRLRQDPRATAEIVGHSDSSGSDDINAQTSRERAEKALAYLVQTHGIDAARVTVSGAGSADPIADNDTPEGRLTNRRVAITVTIPGG